MDLYDQYEKNDNLDRVTGLPWGRDAKPNETAYTVALFTNTLQPIGEPRTKLLLPDLAVCVASQFLSDASSPYGQQFLALHVAAGQGVYSFRCGSDKVIVVTSRPGQGGHYAKRLESLFKKFRYGNEWAKRAKLPEFTEAPNILAQRFANSEGVWGYDVDPAGEPVAGSFRYLRQG